MNNMKTDPGLALLLDISQSGQSEPFDELDGTLTADGDDDGKEISWQAFTSSKDPDGDTKVDSESKDPIDGGEEISYIPFQNASKDPDGDTKVDSESKDPFDGGEEMSYLPFKNIPVPHSDLTKEIDFGKEHGDTIMPSQTLETQNSQDDHAVVGAYDEEFGQEVALKQHQVPAL